jgi:hypothetical protein
VVPTSSRRLAGGVLLVILAAATGCTDPPSPDEPRGTPTPGGTAVLNDAPRTTAAAESVESLAGLVRGRTVQDRSGLPITVTPVTLRREGKLVLLELAARNDGDRQANLPDTVRNTEIVFDGVSLVDPDAAKRYLVARDDKGGCLCTSFFGGLTVNPGATGLLRAYFAAPPPEVSTVTVEVSNVGAFPDVPVS